MINPSKIQVEKMGRQTKKGAKGIWIWRPNPKKVVITNYLNLPFTEEDLREIKVRMAGWRRERKILILECWVL